MLILDGLRIITIVYWNNLRKYIKIVLYLQCTVLLILIPCCSYMMIAPTIQQARCKTWIQRHLPRDCSVSVSDVTSMFTAIAIIGPFTRTLLSELTDTDLSPKSFPFFTYKVGVKNVKKLLNFTYTVFA